MESATSEAEAQASAPEAGEEILLNPHTYEGDHLGDEARRLMRATISWFETRGKEALKEADHERTFYRDFIAFQAGERAFAKLLTPARDGGDDEDKRWDTPDRKPVVDEARFEDVFGRVRGLAGAYKMQG